MDKRVLTNLAIFQAGWVPNSFEAYIPFVLSYVKEKEKLTFSIAEITAWFETELTKKIPIFAMQSILEDVKGKGLIQESLTQNSYVVNLTKLKEFEKVSDSVCVIEKFDQLIANIIAKAIVKHDCVLKPEDVNEVLQKLLLDYDADIVIDGYPKLDTNHFSVTSNIVLNYIEECFEQSNEEYKLLVDVAQGHMLANYAIINNQMDGNLNLSETYFYLDSNFLFAFLKLTDNEFLNTAAFQLLEMISKDSGNIRVFEHIYEEARMIILNSKTWIEDRYSYNPIKASGVTKFLVENEKDVADVDVCIASLRSMLKHYGIEKIPADYQETGKAVIDEDLLYDTISQGVTVKHFSPLFGK